MYGILLKACTFYQKIHDNFSLTFNFEL